MSSDDLPVPFAYLIAAGWALALGAATFEALRRRRDGKPVFYWRERGAAFSESFASGYSHRSWITRLGGASNCLVVAVAGGRLIVRPMFPFNLMRPATRDLEHEVPLSALSRIDRDGTAVRLFFRGPQGDEEISVIVKEPGAFVRALDRPDLRSP